MHMNTVCVVLQYSMSVYCVVGVVLCTVCQCTVLWMLYYSTVCQCTVLWVLYYVQFVSVPYCGWSTRPVH